MECTMSLGAMVSMFAFLNSAMVAASQRFYLV